MIKKNPKYSSLNTKKDLCRVVKKIKDRKKVCSEIATPDHL